MDTGFHKQNIKFFNHFGISEDSGIPAKRIALVLQDEYKNNPNAQETYILSCNLLTRLFLNVVFIIPEGTRVSNVVEKSSQLLSDHVILKAKLIFPKGNFHYSSLLASIDNYDGLLMVGCPNEKRVNLISVISNGWNLYLNKSDVDCSNYNPIGACAAACMGVAELFKYVVKPQGMHLCGELIFSLLNYSIDIPTENPRFPDTVDIGEVTLVGAGAIGSAVIYALKCIQNVVGKLDIVDGDRYSDTNLNRYIVADESTIGKYKVDVAKMLLSHHDELEVNNHAIVYDEYIKQNKKVDTLITAVDKKIVRFNMQSDLPRLIIDAATSDSSIDLARVDFSNGGACLGCLYMPEPRDSLLYQYISDNTGLSLERVRYLYDRSEGVSLEDIKIVSEKLGKDLSNYIGSPIESVYAHEYCGSSTVESNKNIGDAIIAPVSFISALAGVLVTSELIKDRYYRDYKVNNHYFIDTLKVPNIKFHNFKNSSSKCPYCNDITYLEVYKEKWSF